MLGFTFPLFCVKLFANCAFCAFIYIYLSTVNLLFWTPFYFLVFIIIFNFQFFTRLALVIHFGCPAQCRQVGRLHCSDQCSAWQSVYTHTCSPSINCTGLSLLSAFATSSLHPLAQLLAPASRSCPPLLPHVYMLSPHYLHLHSCSFMHLLPHLYTLSHHYLRPHFCSRLHLPPYLIHALALISLPAL